MMVTCDKNQDQSETDYDVEKVVDEHVFSNAYKKGASCNRDTEGVKQIVVVFSSVGVGKPVEHSSCMSEKVK